MKIAIVLNALSKHKKDFYFNILPALNAKLYVKVFETQSEHDATILSSQAVDEQFDIIIAAGGDGTLHQVLNGILSSSKEAVTPMLGVLPIGTGNDFAKAVGITRSASQILKMISEHSVKKIDIGEITCLNSEGSHIQRYFINVADVGMGPTVVKKVLQNKKFLGAAVSYYKSILSTFFTYKPISLTATSKDWSWEDKMRTFAVANGSYFGNGLCIAPHSRLDDGYLNAFACGNVSIADFMIQSIPMKMGKKVSHPKVKYFTTTDIQLQSQEVCEIEADGEWLGYLPARITLVPRKITFLME